MATKTEKPRQSADQELLAMSRITRVLSGLDGAERQRVLAWLNMRHGACNTNGAGNGGLIPFGGSDDEK